MLTPLATLRYVCRPTARLLVDGEDRGVVHTERNLTLVLVDNAGHQLALYTPRPAHKLLRWLLGRIDDEDLRKCEAQG